MARLSRLLITLLVLVSLLALPAGTANAQECTLEETELRSLVDTLNRNVDQVPGFARSQFGGERIDVRIDASDGERRYAVETARNGRITAFEEGVAEDPTLRVETSESTFCGVVTADDPRSAFASAYYSGDIDVEGVGTVNAVKIGAVEIGASIGEFLSGLF